jgi:hypothetical protein
MTLKLYSTGNTPVTFFSFTQATDPGRSRSVPQLRRISRHTGGLALSDATGLQQQESESLGFSSICFQSFDARLVAALDDEDEEEEDLEDEDDDLEDDDGEDLEDEDEDDFDDDAEDEDDLDDDDEELEDEDDEEK